MLVSPEVSDEKNRIENAVNLVGGFVIVPKETSGPDDKVEKRNRRKRGCPEAGLLFKGA